MKDVLFALAERSILASYAMNVGAIVYDLLRFLPSRFRDTNVDYRKITGQIGTLPGQAAINDLPLAFFKSIILDGEYAFVIELGAYSLDRSLALKRAFPTLSIYALDVTADFAEPLEIDGVAVRFCSSSEIERIAAGRHGPGLICAVGTLTCYAPAELTPLLDLLRKKGSDIAVVEPNTIGEESITRSLRRTKTSWYHPYLHLLRKAGYALPFNGGRQVGCAVSAYAETMTYIFAKAPRD